MRWVVFVLCMPLVAGCLTGETIDPTSVPAMQARAEAEPAFVQIIEQTDVENEEWAIASAPYLVRMGGLEGPADHEALHELLKLGDIDAKGQVTLRPGFWSGDHMWLLFAVIGPSIEPAWASDGNTLDGMVRDWSLGYMVEWQQARWSEWRTSWTNGSGGGYGASWSSDPDDDPADCGVPDLTSWRIDSDEALQIALGQEAFARHVNEQDGGEVWLRLLFGHGPWTRCSEPWAPQWSVRWMDADGMLGSGASYVEVHLDATSGAVLDVASGSMKAPAQYAYEVIAQGRASVAVGELGSTRWAIEVPAEETALQVRVVPDRLVPVGTRYGADAFYLHAPDGAVLTDPGRFKMWTWHVEHPDEGTWVLQYDPGPSLDTTHVDYVYDASLLR